MAFRIASSALRSLLAAVLATIATGSVAMAQGPAACEPPYDVGFRIVEFAEGRKAAYWYPTSDEPTLQRYWDEGLSGEFARDGAPSACAPFPLVLFSHGLDACGTLSIFITEEMARHGYVVAAPDHDDASCSVDGQGEFKLTPPQESFFEPEKWTAATHVERRDDLRTLLDFTLQNDSFRQMLDPEAIAVAGHSLGGYAALGVGGAWPSWRDERIKAVLALSPYALPYQAKQALSRIEVPVMFQGADLDLGITPFLDGKQGAYAASKPPRYFVKLRGGTHLEWTVFICDLKSTVQRCLRTNRNARLITDYAVAFLDRYLKGEESKMLDEGASGLSKFERTVLFHVVPGGSFNPRAPVASASIASGFAEALSTGQENAEQIPLPHELQNTTVTIIDQAGATHQAPLFFTSPEQVNFLVPDAAAEGLATVEVRRDGELIASGEIEIDRIAPSLFAANASGSGAAAGFFVRVAANGSRAAGPLVRGSSGEPAMIDTGGPQDRVYLELFGTGLRHASSLVATVGGVEVPATDPFPHQHWVGLDQVNLGPLPRELAGSGVVNIRLEADGEVANEVTIALR